MCSAVRCGTLTTTVLQRQTMHTLFSGPLRPLAERSADLLGSFLKLLCWLRRCGAIPSKQPFRLQLPPGPLGLLQAARSSWRLVANVCGTCCSLRLLARMRARAVYSTAQPSYAQAKFAGRQRAPRISFVSGLPVRQLRCHVPRLCAPWSVRSELLSLSPMQCSSSVPSLPCH